MSSKCSLYRCDEGALARAHDDAEHDRAAAARAGKAELAAAVAAAAANAEDTAARWGGMYSCCIQLAHSARKRAW